MKQTAVEWLEDCLIEKHSNGSFVWNTRADLEALFKQAKKLEKQKMIEMHDKGFDSVVQLNDDYAIGFAEWLFNIDKEALKKQLNHFKEEKLL